MGTQYLIMNLQAPLISYGDVAVDKIRPTDLMPGRSMLTGLIANSLGWKRTEHRKMDRLQERIRYAARTETLHENTPVLVDFQTAQLSKDDKAWTTAGKPEGRAGHPDTYNSPELRYLHYLAEARSIVALYLEEPEEKPTLEDVGEALTRPARALFIGRKACIPSRNIFGGYQEAESATEALQMQPCLSKDGTGLIQWDEEQCHESVIKTEGKWTTDLKDWRNRIHTGQRFVNRGLQTAGEKKK